MRLIKVLTIISIIFSYCNTAQSNDIRDFEINGVNIGDSLLDYFTKEEIENSTKTNYPNQKFYDIHISAESDQYDQLTYTVKNGDNYFIIEQLSGDKFYYQTDSDKNIDKMHLACLKQKMKLVNNLKICFQLIRKLIMNTIYKTVDDGKSFSVVTDFNFDDGSAIRIYCNKFTKETINQRNFFNGLSVSISPIKILNWLDNEAYK
jgi:hypothetical protein